MKKPNKYWGGKTWENFVPYIKKMIEAERSSGFRGTLLEIGAREGDLARNFKVNWNVICSDICYGENVLRESNSNFTYMNLDCTNLSLESETIDVIISKSVLGGLKSYDNISVAFDEVHRTLKPNGLFVFAENVKGSTMHKWLRLLKRGKSLDYWYYFNDKELIALSSKFNLVSKEYFGVLSGTMSFQKYIDLFFYVCDKYFLNMFFKNDNRIVVFMCLQKK